MISATAVEWVTLNMIGGCSLLFLLCTYYVVKTLPQRKNPFLINMVLTSCLGTIPSLMLLFTGQQGGITIHWICVLQAASILGVLPMYGVAQLTLIFQTWSDMRAAVQGTTSILDRSVWLRWALILAPYMAFIGWFIASLVDVLLPSARVVLFSFDYCSNEPLTGANMPRKLVGYFMVVCMSLAIPLEGWTATYVYFCLQRSRVSGDLAHASSSIRANVHMFVRLLIFTNIQLGPIFLTALNNLNRVSLDPVAVRNATQIMESTYALGVFFVFGTQRTVLQAWKIWPSTETEKEHLEC
ncbi:hypothetical protein JB92DRAFT_2899217 [Gautieria morchelliformis]|nr:hypothetical protein JB92DRAFT_2899217 [Gautieria morchelliformis]